MNTEILLILSLILNILILCVLLFKNKDQRSRKEDARLLSLEKGQDRLEGILKEEIGRNRQELNASAKENRGELSHSLKSFGETLSSNMLQIATMQKHQLESFSNQLSALTALNEQKLQNIRETVEERLNFLQNENNEKLEQMRATVDEKLHATLERRLGESFQLVSERLELVHKGLGEMQTLASGVGDLKRVLTNVKTRGIWGEVQLETLLDQLLTREQYEKNVITKKNSNERVEFAILLPGENGGVKVKGKDERVFLPIDAKFPLEDYQRLLLLQEQGEAAGIEDCYKQLELRIKSEARDIKEKYLDPPNTTDFGILFLPVEGLYAEVLRIPGLCEYLQRECRVVVTGPTTLGALLNSLQMGFRTLAIEKRSSEVWALLGVVKTEFGKFGDILEKTQKKLQEASNTIEEASRKSRNIERKLKKVQELPVEKEEKLLTIQEEN